MAIVFNPFTGNFDFTGSSSGSSGLTVGTTTITSGTSGRILYDNAGVLGEATVTGTLGSVVLSTAPTLTGPVTLNEAVGSSGLTITGATQTSSFPALNITQTWNNAGVIFTGVKLNITNTASDNSSNLLDLQIGGSSKLGIGKSGEITTALRVGKTGVQFSLYAPSGTNAATQLARDSQFGWTSSSGDASGTLDTILVRDNAANTLALRNSTNAQTFRVYNTWTDASNGEWFTSNFASNVYHFGTTKNGTGTSRAAQWDYGTTTTGAVTVPSAITGTIVIGDGATGSTTAIQLGGATQTATSGTYITAQLQGTFAPSSTSTMTAIPFHVAPTINYSAGTPGAGGYQAFRISVTETALPTGACYLLHANAGAAGSTHVWDVLNDGTPTYLANTAIPAGGTAGKGVKFSSTSNFGVFFGSGAPSLSAAKGSLYLRSDGSGTTDRAYINTDGGTTWTAITTAA